ncbi:MAG: hydrogenase maturation protease [Proteobacteria bacterium]|nr:hydrogenase maturation protease [Pseudomonadota bacterium]
MSATTLLLAVGNVLRGDDGVAARVLDHVLDQLGAGAGAQAMAVHGLTPELAEAVAAVGAVVILDADVGAATVTLEPLPEAAAGRGTGRVLSHSLTPAALIALARQLYGFNGAAWLCRLPARQLAYGTALSAVAEAAACEGARQLRALLGSRDRLQGDEP